MQGHGKKILEGKWNLLIFNSLIEIQLTHHAVHPFDFTILRLSVYSQSGAAMATVNVQHFHHPKENLAPLSHHPPGLPRSLSRGSCFLSEDVPALGMSCEWNQTVRGLLHLPLAQHNVSEAHSCWSTCLTCVPSPAK